MASWEVEEETCICKLEEVVGTYTYKDVLVVVENALEEEVVTCTCRAF